MNLPEKSNIGFSADSLRKIFGIIYRVSVCTAADISTASGLSSVTVGKAVRELSRRGLVTLTKDNTCTGKGKPACLISIADELHVAVTKLYEKEPAVYLYSLKNKSCEKISFKTPDRCRGMYPTPSLEYAELLESTLNISNSEKNAVCAVFITDGNEDIPLSFRISGKDTPFSEENRTDISKNDIHFFGEGSDIADTETCAHEKFFCAYDRRALTAEKLMQNLTFESALFIELTSERREAFFFRKGEIISCFSLDTPAKFMQKRDGASFDDPAERFFTLSEFAALLFGIFSPDAVFLCAPALSDSEIISIREKTSEAVPSQALFFCDSEKLDLVKTAAESALGLL